MDYPYPVVDYEARAAEARRRYSDLDSRAKEALSDPRIRRRGSFSQRSREEPNGEDATSDGQASLDEFG